MDMDVQAPSNFLKEKALVLDSAQMVQTQCKFASIVFPLPGFLATRVLPGAIGHSILRTSVNPRRIPLSTSQDPELVLLSLDLYYPSGIDPWSFVISTLKNQIP